MLPLLFNSCVVLSSVVFVTNTGKNQEGEKSGREKSGRVKVRFRMLDAKVRLRMLDARTKGDHN
jgi:hypothetical protein